MTTITTGCGCGASSVVPTAGHSGAAGERTRYYPRQVVQAADLTQDQVYFRERMRRHNRMLHGWGIVCGVRVRLGSEPGTVVVEPGYVMGPFGDEITVDDEVVVDLAAQDPAGDAASGCADPDPWCADVKVARPSGRPVYLAIAYTEHACRPVTVTSSGCGCGCEPGACEYSRIRDSWRIRVLSELPSTYPAHLVGPGTREPFSCPPRSPESHSGCECPQCSPCPTEPWVILADIVLDGATVKSLDCDSHRRYVASFRNFFYTCGERSYKVQRLRDEIALSDAALGRLTRVDNLEDAVGGLKLADLQPERGIGAGLRERVAGISVAEARSQSRAEFIARVTTGVHGAAAESLVDSAGELWDKSARLWRIVRE